MPLNLEKLEKPFQTKWLEDFYTTNRKKEHKVFQLLNNVSYGIL